MSMPPRSLKTRTGSFLRPSQVTAAKYSLATSARSSTSTPRGFCPLISSARIARAAASASAGVSANLTPPAFMRPPVSTWDLRTTGTARSRAIAAASVAVRATRARPGRQVAVRVSRMERPLPGPPLPPPAPRGDLDGERARPAARCAVRGVAREHAAEDLARSLGADGLEALEGDRAPRPGPLQGARQAELRRRARRARGGRGHERRAA